MELTFEDDEINNFVDSDNLQFIIRNHKNKRKEGTKYVEIRKNLSKEILNWKKINKSKYVFYKKTDIDNHVSQTQCNNLLHSILGKGKGIHNLRCLHSSKKINEIGVTPEQVRELLKLAKSMGHCLTTSSIDYMKILKSAVNVKNDECDTL